MIIFTKWTCLMLVLTLSVDAESGSESKSHAAPPTGHPHQEIQITDNMNKSEIAALLKSHHEIADLAQLTDPMHKPHSDPHFDHHKGHSVDAHQTGTLGKAHHQVSDLKGQAASLSKMLSQLEVKSGGKVYTEKTDHTDHDWTNHHALAAHQFHGISEADSVLSRIKNEYLMAEHKRQQLIEEVKRQQLQQIQEQKKTKLVLSKLETKSEHILGNVTAKEKEQLKLLADWEARLANQSGEQAILDLKVREMRKQVQHLINAANIVHAHQQSINNLTQHLRTQAEQGFQILEKVTKTQKNHTTIHKEKIQHQETLGGNNHHTSSAKHTSSSTSNHSSAKTSHQNQSSAKTSHHSSLKTSHKSSSSTKSHGTKDATKHESLSSSIVGLELKLKTLEHEADKKAEAAAENHH